MAERQDYGAKQDAENKSEKAGSNLFAWYIIGCLADKLASRWAAEMEMGESSFRDSSLTV